MPQIEFNCLNYLKGMVNGPEIEDELIEMLLATDNKRLIKPMRLLYGYTKLDIDIEDYPIRKFEDVCRELVKTHNIIDICKGCTMSSTYMNANIEHEQIVINYLIENMKKEEICQYEISMFKSVVPLQTKDGQKLDLYVPLYKWAIQALKEEKSVRRTLDEKMKAICVERAIKYDDVKESFEELCQFLVKETSENKYKISALVIKANNWIGAAKPTKKPGKKRAKKVTIKTNSEDNLHNTLSIFSLEESDQEEKDKSNDDFDTIFIDETNVVSSHKSNSLDKTRTSDTTKATNEGMPVNHQIPTPQPQRREDTSKESAHMAFDILTGKNKEFGDITIEESNQEEYVPYHEMMGIPFESCNNNESTLPDNSIFEEEVIEVKELSIHRYLMSSREIFVAVLDNQDVLFYTNTLEQPEIIKKAIFEKHCSEFKAYFHSRTFKLVCNNHQQIKDYFEPLKLLPRALYSISSLYCYDHDTIEMPKAEEALHYYTKHTYDQSDKDYWKDIAKYSAPLCQDRSLKKIS